MSAKRFRLETMKRLGLSAAGAAALLLLLAAGDRPLDGDPTHGKILFKKHCARCHGKEAQGGKKGPRLTDGGRINAVADAVMLQMYSGDARGKGLHQGLKKGLSRLDAWDVIGFLRGHVPHVGDLFPQSDRYIAKQYTADKNARERLKKSLGKAVSEKDATAMVFTMFNTGSGTPLELVPQDPRKLDRLERRMKTGYVVFLPFSASGGGKVQLAIGLEPKLLKIAQMVAVDSKGVEDRDLNKLLSRFRDKGDRRMSGTADARLAVGGGGRQLKDLERRVTEVYLRTLELVTAYEIEERERSWADDDIELPEPDVSTEDFSVK